jgi:hypothetical protein
VSCLPRPTLYEQEQWLCLKMASCPQRYEKPTPHCTNMPNMALDRQRQRGSISQNIGSESGSNTGSESGSNTGSDTGSNTGSNTGLDTGSDTGSRLVSGCCSSQLTILWGQWRRQYGFTTSKANYTMTTICFTCSVAAMAAGSSVASTHANISRIRSSGLSWCPSLPCPSSTYRPCRKAAICEMVACSNGVRSSPCSFAQPVIMERNRPPFPTCNCDFTHRMMDGKPPSFST